MILAQVKFMKLFRVIYKYLYKRLMSPKAYSALRSA